MARIDPISIDKWPTEMREVMGALTPPAPRYPRPVTKGRPKGLNALGTFAHHPALARAFFTFNGHLILATTLTQRQREILVLRVAVLRKSSYEFAQHVVMGRDVGLTDAEIARIVYGPDAPFLDPLEAALIRAVDDLIGDGAISEQTWAVLAGKLDTQQLMDVIFTVGAYETIAFMFQTLGLEFDEDLRQS
jgi:alkylhydroperoxidase family enzyme